MAPTTKNGMAIINKILGLNARPNESLRLAFQLGQAKSAAGLNKMITANSKEIFSLILCAEFMLILYLNSRSYSYSSSYSFSINQKASRSESKNKSIE